MSPLYEMFDHFTPFIFLATAIIYFVHFIYGTFHYPLKYKKYLKMDMEFSCPENNPEKEKEQLDFSAFRGFFICIAWVVIFCVAFHETLSVLAIATISISWFALHLSLAFTTCTSQLFDITVMTLNMTILMPEQYPADEDGEDTYLDLYFYSPSWEDKDRWNEDYLKEYIRRQKKIKQGESDNVAKIKDLSEKLARAL